MVDVVTGAGQGTPARWRLLARGRDLRYWWLRISQAGLDGATGIDNKASHGLLNEPFLGGWLPVRTKLNPATLPSVRKGGIING